MSELETAFINYVKPSGTLSKTIFLPIFFIASGLITFSEISIIVGIFILIILIPIIGNRKRSFNKAIRKIKEDGSFETILSDYQSARDCSLNTDCAVFGEEYFYSKQKGFEKYAEADKMYTLMGKAGNLSLSRTLTKKNM